VRRVDLRVKAFNPKGGRLMVLDIMAANFDAPVALDLSIKQAAKEVRARFLYQS